MSAEVAGRKRSTGTRLLPWLVGQLFSAYIRLLRRTNRIVWEPAPTGSTTLPHEQPFIVAMWHGQHFLVPLIRRPDDRIAVMISRSREGDMQAEGVKALGMEAVRGSGARGRDPRLKGGAPALREMMRVLDSGGIPAMTADIPKIARRCGEGIVTLARLSGRPIYPVAVVTSRRWVLDSWDRTTLGLPFGRLALVRGRPIHVARDAAPDELEAARLAVEQELDRVHERANELVGRTDPGAGLRHSPRTAPAP